MKTHSNLDKNRRGEPRRTPCANFIPPQIGPSFERELGDLVAELAKSDGFKGRYLAAEYLSKYNAPGGVTPNERREAAITKWLLQEARNRETNMRIQLGDADFGWVTSDKILSRTRKIISDTLGRLVIEEVLLRQSGHTNGASTRITRTPKAAILKHTGEAHVSSSALKHWQCFVLDTRYEDHCVELQESSVLFTVPKTAEIDRVACKEPEINMLLQRAVGSHIRHSLRRKGIDLNDQTVNQKLAKSALKDKLATIDLSSASDSITKQLVFELLPFEWWSFLDDLRVKTVDVKGYPQPVELEMFSSMGNGFTFELESLIFWALTRSVMYFSRCKGKLSVYGDDIIAPVAIAPRLARLFAWLGFRVNKKKSYWTGSFRESCGKHYYRNLDVSPFYLKEPVRSKTDLIRILNRLMEWDSRGLGFITHPAILVFHKKWSQYIPINLHGGQDPEDQTALVTGAPPRDRLKRCGTKVEFPQSAGLDCWFMQRSDEAEAVLSLNVKAEGRFVISPMSPYTVRTTWDPHLLLGLSSVNRSL